MKLNPPLSVAGLCLFLMVGISWQVGAYDEDDLEKLQATGDCSGCDLSESDLAGANLFEADLEWAFLLGANLEGANLIGVDLSGADLTDANLKGAKMRGAIFCNTTMPDGTKNNSGC